MKIHIILMIAIIVCCFTSGTALATDDFQFRTTVLVPVQSENDMSRKDALMEYFLPENDWYREHRRRRFYNGNLLGRAPYLYFTLGIQTETTWFDRRLNWSSYSTRLVLDTGNLGVRYQGSFSSAGRDDFEAFDTRLDVYAYWLPELVREIEPGGVRIGGGLSYFDCDPYQGQEFLKDQHYAAFAGIYLIAGELKFVALINDDGLNGGLVELKFFNPFLYLGFHEPNTIPEDFRDQMITGFNILLPFEIGFTGAFGLPAGGNGWGWFIKGRYILLDPVVESRHAHFSLGAEIYWNYKGVIDTGNVSNGWEFGIKFTLVGF